LLACDTYIGGDPDKCRKRHSTHIETIFNRTSISNEGGLPDLESISSREFKTERRILGGGGILRKMDHSFFRAGLYCPLIPVGGEKGGTDELRRGSRNVAGQGKGKLGKGQSTSNGLLDTGARFGNSVPLESSVHGPIERRITPHPLQSKLA